MRWIPVGDEGTTFINPYRILVVRLYRHSKVRHQVSVTLVDKTTHMAPKEIDTLEKAWKWIDGDTPESL